MFLDILIHKTIAEQNCALWITRVSGKRNPTDNVRAIHRTSWGTFEIFQIQPQVKGSQRKLSPLCDIESNLI